jgi:hypothetical protein
MRSISFHGLSVKEKRVQRSERNEKEEMMGVQASGKGGCDWQYYSRLEVWWCDLGCFIDRDSTSCSCFVGCSAQEEGETIVKVFPSSKTACERFT